MLEIKTSKDNDVTLPWKAGIWINREYFYAYGQTEQEAISGLKNHLIGIIPIFENNIKFANAMIEDIKRITNG